MNRPLLFTDLDGSLLDHDTYSHAAASPTLAVLKSLAVPGRPTPRNTLAELLPIRAALNNTDPF
ncbi:MAG: mannosyl-3-phosphoglycerate phosphatase, partial [Pseudomonadales bacterium]